MPTSRCLATLLTLTASALARPTMLAVALAPAAATVGADDLKPIATVEGISEYRLDNGLRVLLFPDPANPRVTVNITYFVGSNHEGRGEKGMAHLLEHMLFKGTPTHPDPWKTLEDHGANFNATTWLDRTNYYETLDASDENLEFALALEADRMVNSLIAEEALAKEMTVVRNEFEMGENRPEGILQERLVSTAFLWHNYGNSTIGNRSDIERVPAGSLRAFYKHHYRPANAVLAVAGKIDTAKTLALIQEHFGSIPNPPEPIIPNWTDEPTQDGPRHVVLERVGANAAVGVMYHVPAAAHEDSVPVELLASVLGDEPTGRLYKALVEPALCTSVSVYPMLMAERGGLVTMAEVADGKDPAGIESIMIDTLENLADHPATDEEVDRARTAALAGFTQMFKSSTRICMNLTEAAASGDWRLLFINRDRLKTATTADVNRVAGAYLVSSNRTSGRFIPTADPVRAQIPPAPDIQSLVKDYKGSEAVAQGEDFKPTPGSIEARVERFALTPGIKAAALIKENRADAVTVRLNLHFGDEKGFAGRVTAAQFVTDMMVRGTKERSYQQIRDEMDRVKSRIGVGGGVGGLTATISSDRENIIPAIELLAEILREPTFPESEFEIIRKERVAGLQDALTDPNGRLGNALARALSPFPPDSVHYQPTLEEEIDRVNALTIEDVKKVYADFFGASRGEASIVGDCDLDQVTGALRNAIAGWESRAKYAKITRPYRPVAPLDETIVTPDKPMAAVAMAAAIEMDSNDKDWPALQFAGYVLGMSSKSRLLTRLRHEDGLSYGAQGMVQADDENPITTVFAFAICARENAQKAQDAMTEEMRAWIDAGVTDAEVTEGKESFRLQFQNQLANDGYIANELARGLYLDRTFKYHADRLDRIAALTPAVVSDTVKRRLSNATFAEIKAGDIKADDAK